MTQWLHDLDSLVALADGPPGEIRDWANTRLALRAPERMVHLPSGAFEASLALAVAANGAQEGVFAGLTTLDPPVIDAVALFGMLPEDPVPWARRLKLRPDLGNPLVAETLADLGGLDAETLGALSRSEDPVARSTLPGLMLRWAAAHDRPLDDLAAQIVAQLDQDQLERPWELLRVVGVPQFDPLVLTDPEEAVDVGSTFAGNPLPVPEARGSARRRAERIARALLDGRPGPAAALLRALAGAPHVPSAWTCAAAAWCAALELDPDPVDAVVIQSAGEDRVVLSAARREVGDEHAELLAELLSTPHLRRVPATALALELIGRRSPHSAALADAFMDGLTVDTLQIAVISFALTPDAIVGGLEIAPAWALLLARYLPTEAVLKALLDLPTYEAPEHRALHGWALAEMADPAAYARLEALAEQDPGNESLAAGRAHGARLLGR